MEPELGGSKLPGQRPCSLPSTSFDTPRLRSVNTAHGSAVRNRVLKDYLILLIDPLSIIPRSSVSSSSDRYAKQRLRIASCSPLNRS